VEKLYTTKSYKQTQKIGEKLALRLRSGQAKEIKSRTSAVILALSGNLGSGKTTFLQGFAKGLGVKEKILSPTFIIMKKFKINIHQNGRPHILTDKYFYHFDCYRINKPEEILELDFKKIISDPKNIVAIEWPERVKKILPKNTIFINFTFINENQREINIKL
jgi:tRNA threonylcarbamoyladenosine biosynthesis protein TsaE